MTDLRLCYQTIEFGKVDIHLCTLRNKQEFYDPDGEAERLGISSTVWPIFGLLWPSGIVLANYINNFNTSSKRILEIGCGTALTSLLLNKRQDDITATDYHPEAGKFLNRNTDLNCDDRITFVRVDWSEQDTDLGLFDLIIGSDLLYEDDHVELVGNFINKHAKQECEVIIVDPGRGRKNKLTQKMEGFGYRSSHLRPNDTDYLAEVFKGYILNFERGK
ncbi:methyltransferase [Paraferrimonas sp. SM1919]|uniref:class I SAM-dependent methyltransferase n=1 Tax=Paraferrimonas sp. SM1919 TaxID=2662263 RepID=UPI0013CFF332|nr:methyltransferase domain-containing protein [Paraferrimonas sp. SM1919]